jgi:hypothetical protein
LTLRILSNIARNPKILKGKLKHINRHHGAHSKTLVPNTFHLKKGNYLQIQYKIKIDVLNVMHPIGNPSINERKKTFFHCKIDKSDSDKDDKSWDIYSYD